MGKTLCLILLFFVTMFAVQTCEAVYTCYSCYDSWTGELSDATASDDCADPFFNPSALSTYTTWCRYGCKKTTSTTKVTLFISYTSSSVKRECASSYDSSGCSAPSGSFSNSESTVCVCRSNNCNSANSKEPVFILILVAAVGHILC